MTDDDVPQRRGPARRVDPAALRRAMAAARVGAIGPCNSRCQSRGSCAFGRVGPEGGFCRERRPPRRGEPGSTTGS